VKKIDILKKSVSFVVSAGVAKIIKGVIENNVSTTTAIDKVTVAAASAAIGGAVGELSSDYTNHQIDELVAFVQKIKNRKNESEETKD
jgi:hypothetical protein